MKKLLASAIVLYLLRRWSEPPVQPEPPKPSTSPDVCIPTLAQDPDDCSKHSHIPSGTAPRIDWTWS